MMCSIGRNPRFVDEIEYVNKWDLINIAQPHILPHAIDYEK